MVLLELIYAKSRSALWYVMLALKLFCVLVVFVQVGRLYVWRRLHYPRIKLLVCGYLVVLEWSMVTFERKWTN